MLKRQLRTHGANNPQQSLDQVRPPRRAMRQHAIVLPSVFVVGFTGHRELPDEAASRARITELLAEQKAAASGVMCGLASVAAGGDLLFAESCIELGLPLRVLLPMPKVEFRTDFDAPTWARVERVLVRALAVEVTGNGAEHEARYYECGIETVRRSDALIALWNGEPSRGLGGTEQIVNYARAEGRLVLWIDSRTGAVKRLNDERRQLIESDLTFLNSLPELAPARTNDDDPAALAVAWFSKLDSNASRTAPQVRRIAAVPILCTAAASVLSTIGSTAGATTVWLVLGTVVGFAAALLPAALGMRKRQTLWARIRTATEVCRSHLAFWKAPGTYDVIGPEVVPELAEMLSSLSHLKVAAGSELGVNIEEFKREYRRGRVHEQIEYFTRYAATAARNAQRYKWLTTIAIAIAIAANVWTFADTVWMSGTTPEAWKPALALTATVFFQVATIGGAVLAVNDYNRRRHRYREMRHLLEQWDTQLEFARTWPVLLQVARKIERALLAEVIEWRSLIRHRKLAQS